MNKIIGALVLAVVIVVLLYAGFTKVMTHSCGSPQAKRHCRGAIRKYKIRSRKSEAEPDVAARKDARIP